MQSWYRDSHYKVEMFLTPAQFIMGILITKDFSLYIVRVPGNNLAKLVTIEL